MITQNHKALMTKTGEWAHYVGDGTYATSNIPRILAPEATIEGLKNYMINVEGVPEHLVEELINKLKLIDITLTYNG